MGTNRERCHGDQSPVPLSPAAFVAMVDSDGLNFHADKWGIAVILTSDQRLQHEEYMGLKIATRDSCPLQRTKMNCWVLDGWMDD